MPATSSQRPPRLLLFLLLAALALIIGQDRDTCQAGASRFGCGPFGPLTARTGGMTAGEPPWTTSAEVQTDFEAVARAITETMPAAHLLRTPFDEERSSRAWTNYFAALDFERVYFLQDDLERFESSRLTLAEDLKEGSITLAEDAFLLFRERVAERVGFVENMLQEPLDFSAEEQYPWRRRQAPWPRNREEQDDLWRLRIKNEVLARIVSQELQEQETEQEQEQSGDPPLPPVENDDERPPPEPGTSGADIGGEEPAAPEETVLKRYRQFLMMLEDSDEEYRMSRFFNAVATAFDPHSGYLSPVALEDFGINMQLSLQGIGAQLRSEDGAARVVEIIPGGPADRDTRDIRLVPGDRIIGVGQGDEPVVDTLHWPLYKTVRLIRGPKNTKVVLLVQPASDPSGTTTRTVDLIRDEVRLEEQAATSSIETVPDAHGGTERRLGIIRLPTFYSSMGGNNGSEPRSAALDVARLLADLNHEAVEGLVLDLRGNGGGALKEAIDLVGLFIRTGPVVLVKERTRIHTLVDQDPAIAFRQPMVVLIDRISASASEIVAGALKDHGRAVIVGDSRTHGKGTVQQILPLDDTGDLGSVKVTNASFYRISGSSTQARGIEADIAVPSAFDYFADLGEDQLPNAIPWSTVRAASYRPITDLSDTIETLREQSSLRRVENPRWQRHARRLERIERINQMDHIPLQIDQRRAFARDEQDLKDLDEEWMEEGLSRREREAARRAHDVVLDEALQIAIDLIDVHGPLVRLQQTEPTGGERLFERFFR